MFNISQTIRKVMIDKNKTISDIVKKSGILQSTLSRSLQKADNDYRINYLNQIVQALNCNIRIQIIDNDSKEVLYAISDIKTDRLYYYIGVKSCIASSRSRVIVFR